MSEYLPKFKIGDKVFVPMVSESVAKVQCPDCLGTKQWFVSLPSGHKFLTNCATCEEGFDSTGFVKKHFFKAAAYPSIITSYQVNTAIERPVSYVVDCNDSSYAADQIFDNEIDALKCADELSEKQRTIAYEKEAEILSKKRSADITRHAWREAWIQELEKCIAAIKASRSK